MERETTAGEREKKKQLEVDRHSTCSLHNAATRPGQRHVTLTGRAHLVDNVAQLDLRPATISSLALHLCSRPPPLTFSQQQSLFVFQPVLSPSPSFP